VPRGTIEIQANHLVEHNAPFQKVSLRECCYWSIMWSWVTVILTSLLQRLPMYSWVRSLGCNLTQTDIFF